MDSISIKYLGKRFFKNFKKNKMKAKFRILISVILIYSFLSSNILFAVDIKINKKVSEKNYKLSDMKLKH